MMDGNKDEALKCLRIGKDALDSGDRTRAHKFINKARRLDPSLDVEDLHAKCANSDNRPSPEPSSTSTAPEIDPKPENQASSNGASARSYTEEQITVVRQIKKKKDYYEILGLEKGCSEEEVRKAYRKLSLKVHPDKNTAPGAEEAFKSVSKAFQCLSNEESRKKYDVLGTEEQVYNRPAARNRHYNSNFYEADFDADEIFRNFFYGGNPGVTTQFGGFSFRTGGVPFRHANVQAANGSPNWRILIQLLPVLLLLLFNLFSYSDPVYSLQNAYPYELKMETPRRVPYFVKSEKFLQDYPKHSLERQRLENRIEQEYINVLRTNCRTELQRRQWGFSYETPHCDMLKKFTV